MANERENKKPVAPEKKPYVKPRVSSEKRLTRAALACNQPGNPDFDCSDCGSSAQCP